MRAAPSVPANAPNTITPSVASPCALASARASGPGSRAAIPSASIAPAAYDVSPSARITSCDADDNRAWSTSTIVRRPLTGARASDVDRATQHRERRFPSRLAQRRMWMHRERDVLARAAELQRQRQLRNELRRRRPNQMRSEKRIRLGVRNELHEARRVA